jgi:hypothetical protein
MSRLEYNGFILEPRKAVDIGCSGCIFFEGELAGHPCPLEKTTPRFSDLACSIEEHIVWKEFDPIALLIEEVEDLDKDVFSDT